jgi:predicted esterase
MIDEKTIETRTHGRYLVRTPASPGPWPMLVGFHGYGENADINLDAISHIPGADRWLLVSVQAPHPFYTKNERVVASWMTRQLRELAIADNVEYVSRVLDAVRSDYRVTTPLVFAGFSQGGAMAYRAAARHQAALLVILASDVPPDVAAGTRVPLPQVILGRGTGDEWYTEDKHDADVAALRGLNVNVESCVFDGGHEWGQPFYDAVGQALRGIEAAR